MSDHNNNLVPLFSSLDSVQLAEQFWQWSCRIYQNKEVATICLSVQDKLELNVNYLLLSLWTEAQNIRMNQEVWLFIINTAKDAEEAVYYIREKRVSLKKVSPDAYQQALLIELKAEKEHQKQAIQGLCHYARDHSLKAPEQSNLHDYLESQKIAPEHQLIVAELGELVKQASH